jgi:hypothetical protein
MFVFCSFYEENLRVASCRKSIKLRLSSQLSCLLNSTSFRFICSESPGPQHLISRGVRSTWHVWWLHQCGRRKCRHYRPPRGTSITSYVTIRDQRVISSRGQSVHTEHLLGQIQSVCLPDGFSSRLTLHCQPRLAIGRRVMIF